MSTKIKESPILNCTDAELDNFIGQEPVNPQQPIPPNPPATSTIELPPAPSPHTEDSKQSSSQPPKQGYLTSILSSLPNLSLSSITGESSQLSQEPESTNHYVPSQPRRDSLRATQPQLAFGPGDPRGTLFSGPGEVNPGVANVPPPQPSLPPAAATLADGPVSYRLGNQRRLKYAPPPDITSNTPKQYPTALDQQSFFPSPVLPGPSSIFNPAETTSPPQIYNPLENLPAPVEQTTRNNFPQGPIQPVSTGNVYSGISPRSITPQGATPKSVTPKSITPQSVTPQSVTPQIQPAPYYETVPLTVGNSSSTPRPIPSQIPVPATPQNTPANTTLSGFELRAKQREFLTTPGSEAEPVVVKPDWQGNRLFPEEDQLCSAAEEKLDPVAVESTFTPVSALKVTEKLEHILAEQKERSEETTVESTTEGKFEKTGSEEGSGDVSETPDAARNDPLSDVFLGEKQPGVDTAVEKRPSGTEEASEKPGPSAQPFQYYQQQQQEAPTVFNPSFFTEYKSEGKSSSSCDISGVGFEATGFPGPTRNFARSASSFFDAAGAESFPPFPSEGTVPTVPPALGTTNGPPVSKPAVASTEPAVVIPQTLWSPDQRVEPVQQGLNEPPPPFLYDRPRLQQNYQSPGSSTLPLNEQTVQAGQLFVNPVGSPQSVFHATPPLITTSVPEPTGSATLNPVQMSVNPLAGRQGTDTVPPSLQNLATGNADRRMQYRSVYHHWFYRKQVEHKTLWLPFSMQDSLELEEVHNSSEITPETVVATDGGRYDVDILRRQRSPVYWTGSATEVRRCSWFYKGPTESKYIPYDESTAARLEEEYKQACLTNNWNRRIDLNNGEYIVFHSATVQVHYSQATSPELAASWGNSAGAASRPRVIKRGLDEFHIEDGEPEKVDHLLFLVHGIGSVCDLKFRTVEEVVDEFRSISLQLVQSHYRTASEQRVVNRIEVLPISWHTTLHSEDTGIDKKLQALTLESIPKLRHFTNDTLLDILFYTSPIFCQTIIETVGGELNRLYTLFQERNPGFDGGIYLGGHSLGSLILFDLLCHQKPLPTENTEEEEEAVVDNEKTEEENGSVAQSLPVPVMKRRLSKKISYVMGAAGTGQPYIHYPQLNFHPRAFFALGSPIGMFVTVRGIDTLGEDFTLPTCPAFFNIFHPFDPVAYRVESLINPEAHKYRPMLIPHHKGRKRMHLELKETMARVGADLKQKLLDSVRSTWNSVYQLALFHRSDNALEREIDKVVEEQLQKTPTVPEPSATDDGGADFKVGRLNGGRRIDYVLQEAPLEYINEYIFALTSHVCYWESEDTMLMILKEIYGSTGIQTDAQLPQQTLSIERVPTTSATILSPSTSSRNDLGLPPAMGVDPTAPISDKPVGPPPKSGFVRKS